MNKLVSSLAAGAALTALSVSCAEPEAPDPAVSFEQPAASTVFSPRSDEEPLPADQVFIPDVHAEDGALVFRIRMLPGYYLYKDKIGLRSLSDNVGLDDHRFNEEWSHSEVVVDEWFGEQEVFFTEAHGAASMRAQTPGIRSIEFELSYQGCKKDGICYMPQSKVLSVDMPTQLKSAADQPE